MKWLWAWREESDGYCGWQSGKYRIESYVLIVGGRIAESGYYLFYDGAHLVFDYEYGPDVYETFASAKECARCDAIKRNSDKRRRSKAAHEFEERMRPLREAAEYADS